MTVQVASQADAPVAVADSYSVAEDGLLTVVAPGVLANDDDVDGGPLTAALVDGVEHGTLVLSANGSFSYDPVANYSGLDSFTYRASDGALQSPTVTVTISVTGVNDLPVGAPDSYSVAEDGFLNVSVPGVLVNDSDPEGAPLTAVLVDGVDHGTLVLNANGSFTYDPVVNYAGSDSFTYRPDDGPAQSVNPVTVSLTVTAVNDAPVAVADSYTVAEDGLLTVVAPGVLGNDDDVEGSPLTAAVVTGTVHGDVTLSASGSFAYDPDSDYSGSDSFTYRVSDGSLLSASVTVSITVTGANDAPVGVSDGPYVVVEDGFLSVAAPGVLDNDSDPEGAPLTAVLVDGVDHGTLVLDANGSFTFDPVADYAGSDSFAYRPDDGPAQSLNPVLVSLSVTAVNDAPVASADSYTVAEDGLLTVVAPGVLGNDDDVENSPLTAAVVTGPAHGDVTLSGNGSFTYDSDADYSGPDSFSYRVSDGVLLSVPVTVSITVTGANDAPVGAPDSYSVAEDGFLTVAAPGVLDNDSDPEGAPLTAVLVDGVDHGTLVLNANGSFTYDPVANYSGPDSFTYRPDDGPAQSVNPVTVSLTVTAVNDAPVAVADSYTVAEDTTLAPIAPGVLGNDDDVVEHSPLTAVLVDGVDHGTLTLNGNGSFSYKGAADYNGSDSFTYRASDGTAQSAVTTVSIVVTAVNDPPVGAADSYTVDEETTLTRTAAQGVLANDSDVETPRAALKAALVTAPASGTLTLAEDGSFTYAPVADYAGTLTFTYRPADPTVAAVNPTTVTITVSPVDDPPVAPPVLVWLLEGGAQSFDVATAPGVSDGDPEETQTLTVTPASATTARGGTTACAGAICTYTPPAGFVGVDTVDYTLSDGTLTASSTMRIHVGFPHTALFAGTGCTIDRAVSPTANGTAGNDVICGTNGNDTIDGGGGDDLVVGYDGNDILTGGTGNDQLHGWVGDDQLEPAAGADRNVGGAGADTVKYVATSAADTVEVTSTGAALPDGTDTHAQVETVTLDAGAGDDDVELVPGTGVRFVLQGGPGFDFLSRPANIPAGILTASGFEAITGGVNLSVGSPGNDLRRYFGSAAVGLRTDMLAGSDRVEVTFGSLLGPVEVTDSGPRTDTDRLVVVASGGPDTVVLKGLTLSRRAGTRTERVILSGQEALTIVMAGGNDLLDLDLRGVAPAALAGPRSVLVDGGSGVDTLKVHSPSIECGSIGTGRLTLPGYGTISLAGVETVEIDCFDGRRTNVLSLVDGYWLVDRRGAVSRFGPVGSYGRPATIPGIPVIGIGAAADKQGYWTVRSNGSVDRFGSAPFAGDIPDLQKRGILGPLNAPVVGIAATNTGRGYYMLGRDGGIFTFGDARFFGSTGSIRLNKPVTAMAAHPSGKGYWFVAEDGGIFTYGADAGFHGSVPGVLPPGVSVNKPVVGIAPTASGRGYWLVAADGGVFAFGDARYYGSVPGVLGGRPLNRPVVGIVPTVTGKGYWIVAEDGGVFTFGDARFFGSLGGGGGGGVVALAG